MNTRTYHDPLHFGIKLDSSKPAEEMIMKLIDSPPFQRLRRIRQLGPAFLTFHGAESSRFTHSLGVFHIARKAFNLLIKIDPEIETYRGLLYGASLLHDIGHGPLSHTGEEVFGLNHENWSAKLIKEHSGLNNILDTYSAGTSDRVAELLGEGKSPIILIKSLVSSQLDCDRLDYLVRDSYSTGTRYGQLDIERILSALTIAPDGDLAIHPKGLMAVEHYLVVRNLMYKSVYNHRLNEVCNWLLEKIISLAKELGPNKIWADNDMAKWLWKKQELSINSFLANDDIRTGYHLLRWSDEASEPLKDLCIRFLNRNLLKAIDINKLSNNMQLEALAIARKFSEENRYDPNIYCGLRRHSLHGYHPYIGGLRLWDGTNLQALENSSDLVKTLIKPIGTSWLIYPKEIHVKLKQSLNKLANNLG